MLEAIQGDTRGEIDAAGDFDDDVDCIAPMSTVASSVSTVLPATMPASAATDWLRRHDSIPLRATHARP